METIATIDEPKIDARAKERLSDVLNRTTIDNIVMFFGTFIPAFVIFYLYLI
jgi:hypothetical protein